MDLLAQINAKVASNPEWKTARGIEAVLTHIDIAERYHGRAKSERDEHLYTDVIYRTNHAYEGILKEAYVLLAGQPVGKMSPYDIEEYFISSNTLKSRVADLLKNYRQNWRNPSTHDHQLFFSEQESFLAIVTVSAFVSILLDQMLERVAFLSKSAALEGTAHLARESIPQFEHMSPIDKVWRVIASFADHYIKNFSAMSKLSRSAASAQLAAFIAKVAPEFAIQPEVEFLVEGRRAVIDLLLEVDGNKVAIETREPRPRNDTEAHTTSSAAMAELERVLRTAGLSRGVLFFFPADADEVPIATTASSSWPADLEFREVYGANREEVEGWEQDAAPVSLVDGG